MMFLFALFVIATQAITYQVLSYGTDCGSPLYYTAVDTTSLNGQCTSSGCVCGGGICVSTGCSSSVPADLSGGFSVTSYLSSGNCSGNPSTKTAYTGACYSLGGVYYQYTCGSLGQYCVNSNAGNAQCTGGTPSCASANLIGSCVGGGGVSARYLGSCGTGTTNTLVTNTFSTPSNYNGNFFSVSNIAFTVQVSANAPGVITITLALNSGSTQTLVDACNAVANKMYQLIPVLQSSPCSSKCLSCSAAGGKRSEDDEFATQTMNVAQGYNSAGNLVASLAAVLVAVSLVLLA